MNDLITVIVPIYKVEPYLKKCVDSIINQTYINLEIILIDDGSPDNCPQICDEYASKDSRIKVIHQENGGLSAARNSGLDIMTGDFVTFVDSDDWVEPTMIEIMTDNIKRWNSDISVVCAYSDLEDESGVRTIQTTKYEKSSFSESNIDAMKRYFSGCWAAWDKLFISTIFSDIRFPIGEINEDEAVVLQVLNKCNSVCYTNNTLYHYMNRPNGNSITKSSFSEKKLDWQNHCKANYEWVIKNQPSLRKLAAKKYCSSLLWSISALAASDFSDSSIKQLTKELKSNFSAFIHANLNFRMKLQLILFSLSPIWVIKKYYADKTY